MRNILIVLIILAAASFASAVREDLAPALSQETVSVEGVNDTASGETVKTADSAKSGSDKLFTDCEFQTDCPANEGCNKEGKCEYNSFIPQGEGNKCFTNRQCHKGNTCENEHCVGLW